MITVVIQGGLGNQLFQYAYGKALQSLGKEVEFNVSFFLNESKYTKRELGLTYFAIDTSIPFTSKPYKQTVWKKILGRLDVDRRNRYVPISEKDDEYIADGYYTSEKYFIQIRDILLKELILKSPSEKYIQYKNIITASKSPLVIHARRGDYLTSSGFVILDKDYYQKALKEFDEECELFGFSDDPEWLKSVVDRPLMLISGQGLTDYEELSLMTLGQNFIIANSTFSWWGAWLSQYPHKKVITPKKWFTSLLWLRANRDTTPKEWVKI